MKSEKPANAYTLGKIIGYLVVYLIFTAILFLILNALNKIPENWGFIDVGSLTLCIVLCGTLLKLLLS